jgi:penicillin-binding protein 1A
VVTEGTGGAAALDFTNVAGKTGTSTGPKDAWFMGFTGKYVAGIWIGNDDNRPMRSGVTGGHQAAPIWHDLMTVAHTDMNIPAIPGLALHPRQIEEQQRVAALKAAQVDAGLEPAAPQLSAEAAAKPQSIMPDKTRDVLKVLAVALRKASGLGDTPSAPPATGSPPAASTHGPPAPPAEAPKPEPRQPADDRRTDDRRTDARPTDDRPDRRATLFDMSHDDLSVPAAAPAPASQAAPIPRPSSGPR